MNSLDPGVFTHTDGAPGLVSTSPLPVLPVPSFFLFFFRGPAGPRSPSPPGSYFFFSAAVSDTFVCSLFIRLSLFSLCSFFFFFFPLRFSRTFLSFSLGHRERYRCLPRLLADEEKTERRKQEYIRRRGREIVIGAIPDRWIRRERGRGKEKNRQNRSREPDSAYKRT